MAQFGLPKHNIEQWLQENEHLLEPPVMNKLMYGAGQLKVMYVGGPNIRSDYHLEMGEELFYMHRGDMVVKILERDRFVDVKIAEGELFLLPGRIPHSPQRFADTIGLVIEREREPDEWDCLRWYVRGQEEKPESLWESFFHCVDLGVQLKPVIEQYFASEAHKTNQPTPGTTLVGDEALKAPIVPDSERVVPKPIKLASWIEEHALELRNAPNGCIPIDTTGEFQVLCYGYSDHSDPGVENNDSPATNKTENASKKIHFSEKEEHWIWQWRGTSDILIHSSTTQHENQEQQQNQQQQQKQQEIHVEKIILHQGDCQLILIKSAFSVATDDVNSITLVISMIPRKSMSQ